MASYRKHVQPPCPSAPARPAAPREFPLSGDGYDPIGNPAPAPIEMPEAIAIPDPALQPQLVRAHEAAVRDIAARVVQANVERDAQVLHHQIHGDTK